MIKFGDQPAPDITSNYHGGNENSKAAWHHGASKDAKNKGNHILFIIETSNGITCEEIEDRTGWKHQTVSARITKLKKDKLIIEVGKRKTRSGCKAAIYKKRDPDDIQVQMDLF